MNYLFHTDILIILTAFSIVGEVVWIKNVIFDRDVYLNKCKA